MGYQLYLAEKPKMGALIASALARLTGQTPKKHKDHITGDGWVVCWLAGHAYELLNTGEYKPEWGVSWDKLDLPIIPSPFRFKPIAGDYIEAVRSRAASLLQAAESVVVATDSGQEGQIIAAIFLKENQWQGKTYRLWSSSTEVPALMKDIQKLEPNDLPKYQGLEKSGFARLYADWIIGINFTIAYTNAAKRAGYDFLASAGRVQSTLLSICVEHDDMVKRFRSSEYYDTTAVFVTETGEEVEAKLQLPSHLLDHNGYCRDIDSLNAYINANRTEEAIVSSLQTADHTKHPPTPYNLTTLSIAVSNHLGLPSITTLEKYQPMYESGWLTYPRTDDTFFEDEFFEKAPNIIGMLAGLDTEFNNAASGCDFNKKPNSFNSSKVEEHTANAPTGSKPNWEALDTQSREIYRLVANMFMAQFYPDYQFQITHAHIKAGGLSFSIKGKRIIQAGWTSLISTESEDDGSVKDLPHGLTEGSKLTLLRLDTDRKKTKAPPRLTEARLLAIMKDSSAFIKSEQTKRRLKGKAKLGTAATRGEHINSLVTKRRFVSRDKNGILEPTKAGRQVQALLPPELTSPDLTAIWEITFEQIRKGQSSADDFLSKLQNWIVPQMHKAKSIKIEPNPMCEKCPSCGSLLVRKESKSNSGSFFWSCIAGCGHISADLNGKPVEPLEGDGDPCPKCGEAFQTRVRKRDPKAVGRKAIASGDRRFLMCKNGHFKEKDTNLQKKIIHKVN